MEMEVWWVAVGLLTSVVQLVAQFPKPRIASPQFAPGNPTLTTVSLERPFCVFDSSLPSSYQPNSVSVEIYVAQSSVVASQAVTATGKTFQQTSGGSIEPYQAAALSMPDCRNLPSLSNVTDALQRYLFRVGSDTQCLNSADITVLCNAPLLNNTAYRFKYLLVGVNGSSKHVLAQTPWSDAIFTKQIKAFEAIDTWPGKMTGGQVVVTTILIVLLFVLLCACVATLVFSIWGNGLPKMESTRHASQITQQVQLSATTETAASGATADEKAISYASQHP